MDRPSSANENGKRSAAEILRRSNVSCDQVIKIRENERGYSPRSIFGA